MDASCESQGRTATGFYDDYSFLYSYPGSDIGDPRLAGRYHRSIVPNITPYHSKNILYLTMITGSVWLGVSRYRLRFTKHKPDFTLLLWYSTADNQVTRQCKACFREGGAPTAYALAILRFIFIPLWDGSRVYLVD